MNVYKPYAKDYAYPPTSVSMVSGSHRVQDLLTMFPKATKEAYSGAGTTKDTDYLGVIFGTGTTQPTLDDYQMSGEHFVEYTVSQSLTVDSDDLGVTYTCVYTLTSTASEDVTIGEIGLSGVAKRKLGSSFYCTGFLVERTLLETPITISPGGVAQITYTLRINYPTL